MQEQLLIVTLPEGKMATADNTADKLVGVIEESGIVTVLRNTEASGSLRLLCRVSDKKRWCAVLEYVLAKKEGWTEHICQQYFMKEDQLVYGWNLILTSEDLPAAYSNACKLFKAAVNAVQAGIGRTKKEKGRKEPVDSMPLIGASPRRTMQLSFDPRLPGPSKGGPSHKGAFSIGGGG